MLKIYLFKPDIDALTEITPQTKNKPLLNEYIIDGCDCFLSENPVSGVALHTKTKMNAVETVSLNKSNFEEGVWISKSASNGIKVLIGCLYTCQDGSPYNNQLSVELFGCKDLSKFDFICIVSDFNFPKIDWSNLCTDSGDDKQFIDALGDAYLSQLVEKPTKFKGLESSFLDLVIINNEFLVFEIVHDNQIGKSDHDLLTFELYINFNVTDSDNMYQYNLKKGRYNVNAKLFKKF